MSTIEWLVLVITSVLLGVAGIVSRRLELKHKKKQTKKSVFEFRVDYWNTDYNAWHGAFYDCGVLCKGYLFNVNENERLSGCVVKATAEMFDETIGLWRMKAARGKASQGKLSAKLVCKLVHGWKAEIANSDGVVLIREIDDRTTRTFKEGDVVEVAYGERAILYIP